MPRDEIIIQKEIMGINLHLPRRRVSLEELLSYDNPYIVLRNGSNHHFKRSELKYLSELLEREEWKDLKLPIILEVSTVNRGYFRVRGSVEVKVIDKILGEFDPLSDKSESLYPRYLLPRIRRVLPTTTTYAFVEE